MNIVNLNLKLQILYRSIFSSYRKWNIYARKTFYCNW